MITNLWRLMRFDKPIGIVLLWAPTAWALWLATHSHPSSIIIIYFLLGTICMRAAGCIINDLIDRNIDIHVQRTCQRPLATGAISPLNAIICLAILCSIALWIVLQLPTQCLYYAIAAIIIIIIYPFMKRCFKAPQLILGIAFSLGIPMAYVTVEAQFNTIFWILCSLNFLWILAYDTMYSMVDKDDDARIGVESTARLFGKWVRTILIILHICLHSMWLMIAYLATLPTNFYIIWGIGILLLYYQQVLIARSAYFKAFMHNASYGLIMWVGLWNL